MLLHYVLANGVEDFRQKTPVNLVEIATLVLKGGAVGFGAPASFSRQTLALFPRGILAACIIMYHFKWR